MIQLYYIDNTWYENTYEFIDFSNGRNLLNKSKKEMSRFVYKDYNDTVRVNSDYMYKLKLIFEISA